MQQGQNRRRPCLAPPSYLGLASEGAKGKRQVLTGRRCPGTSVGGAGVPGSKENLEVCLPPPEDPYPPLFLPRCALCGGSRSL